MTKITFGTKKPQKSLVFIKFEFTMEFSFQDCDCYYNDEGLKSKFKKKKKIHSFLLIFAFFSLVKRDIFHSDNQQSIATIYIRLNMNLIESLTIY